MFLTEFDTLAAAEQGRSIARFGDGELKLATGRSAKSQEWNPHLQARLCRVLKAPDGPCLVCLPITDKRSPKYKLWQEYARPQFTSLWRANGTYGSAFITRPDSAPWIDVPEYWERMIGLWRDRDIVLVRGSTKGFTAADLAAARSVEEIVAPRQHAFPASEELFQRLRKEKRRVILCLGASATVLAFYLAQEGVHALDLGHVGMFMRKEGRMDRESFPP